MKNRILLLFLMVSIFAQAQTIEVSGTQSGVWNADTVLVTGDIKVQDSLRILAGTTVLFDGFYSIRVENGASLTALGTENDSILFTIDDTTGFHVFNSGRGGWNGIRLNKADACQFDYCRFQYGKAALNDDQDGGALRIFGSDDVEISHSTLFCNFSREHGGALNAEDSKVVIHNCKVNNNLTYTKLDTVYFMYGGGLRFLKCEVDITDTDFRYNIGQTAIGGALSLDSCAVNIDRCKFEHNYGINGGGLYFIRSNHLGRGSITNSLFANNTSGHFGGGLALCDASPWIANLTVVNNHSLGVNCGGIFFYQYCEPILWNCIIYGNTNEVPLEEPVQMWAWIYEESKLQFYNCLVQYGLENITNNEAVSVYLNCLDEDPLFLDPEQEDFHLSANSPCINTGYTFGTEDESLDLDGHWRVCGERTDIGAYEYSEASVSETIQNEQLIRIIGNPVTTSSYAEIECESACNLFAKVYIIDGKLLVNKNLGKAQTGINRIEIGELFQHLTSGTYLFVIETPEKPFVAKIVKQ
jgi:hypothetical protein